jgi:hypothetical protein
VNNATIVEVDDEAVALRQFYFADDDNVIIRHFREARASCLCWQIGVLEPEDRCNNGKTLHVEVFHLMLFARTKDELKALLDGHNGLPS